jgi:hypothetical protein
MNTMWVRMEVGWRGKNQAAMARRLWKRVIDQRQPKD